MNPNSTQAIMGQSRYRVMPPDEVSAVKEDRNELKRTATKQESETVSLANLNNNPGWMILEAKFQERINKFRSGSYLVSQVEAKAKSAELGDLLYREMQIAAELENLIRMVNNAYMTIENEKEERRAAIRANRTADN